jgi:deazaflavin-dependent oxidoreductase (nitroreductase family)
MGGKRGVKRRALVLLWRLHRAIYRLTGGRVGGRLRAMRVLLLTTVGRRSGRLHTVVLSYWVEGPHLVVVASSGGSPRHPEWFLNLRMHPTASVQAGSAVWRVAARVAGGSERARLWARIIETERTYATYARRTSRRIPIVVLEPHTEDSLSVPGHGRG